MVTHSFLGNPARVAAIIAVLILAYTFMTGPESLAGAAIQSFPVTGEIEVLGGAGRYHIGQTLTVAGANLQASHLYELRLGETFVAYIKTDSKGMFSYTFTITETLSPKQYTSKPLALLDGDKRISWVPVYFYIK